jgi:hypothetical protein
MRVGRTLFGQTFLTILFFVTKSTLHCHHLPFFAYNLSNSVHLCFVTALAGAVNPVLQVAKDHLFIETKE